MADPDGREDITFDSNGDAIAGWYFPVPGAEQAPVVVMAHGFAALKEMALEQFARAFVDAGLAAVVFDHPCFGASGGRPRQEVDPQRQVQAYRDAIGWAGRRPELDRDRVGVWGTSFSGGHALTLAATDPRVRCAVAQIPYVAPPVDAPPEDLTQLLDDPAFADAGPFLIPVVTERQDDGGLLSPDPEAYRWYTELASGLERWHNEVTARSVVNLIGYRPIDLAGAVAAPTLVIVAVDDVLAPAERARAAWEAIPVERELVELPGHHFGVYGDRFGLASQAAAGWFCRWLRPASA